MFFQSISSIKKAFNTFSIKFFYIVTPNQYLTFPSMSFIMNCFKVIRLISIQYSNKVNTQTLGKLLVRGSTVQVSFLLLIGSPDNPSDSMAVSNFSHDAVASTIIHSENIMQQRCSISCGQFTFITFSLAPVRPSSIPISLQCTAYCSVTCRRSSFSVHAAADTVNNFVQLQLITYLCQDL